MAHHYDSSDIGIYQRSSEDHLASGVGGADGQRFTERSLARGHPVDTGLIAQRKTHQLFLSFKLLRLKDNGSQNESKLLFRQIAEKQLLPFRPTTWTEYIHAKQPKL